MFKKLFKKTEKQKDLQIHAPITGKVVTLEEVPDPVFNQKMMGEGVAVIPSEGKLLSPVNGKIIHIAETKHAIGIEATDGTEILIHVGLETVELKGEGFTVNIANGNTVSVGDSLIDFDLEYIKEHASSSITPIVITNSSNDDKSYTMINDQEIIAGETVIITSSVK